MTWAKDLERAAIRRIVIEIAHYAQFACRMKLYEWKKKKKKKKMGTILYNMANN